MTTDVSTDINKNKNINGSLLTGALLIVLGIVAIAVPNVSTIVAETWIALILSSAGVAKAVYAFQTRDQGAFIWKLLLSVLYIATGVMLFFYPLTGVLTLTLLLGSFLLTEGVFNLILAFRVRPQQNWTWVLTDGIITLVLGAMIWFQWPFNAPWLIGTLVGASVLSTGVSRVMLSLNARSALNQSNQAA
ncbi:HdeD family acid-resistance protein [Funiculus sociatus GB2-A5]|uniref:HdeD family acid-resistance protein n=1 Tax=Funiculus sociatus GB2-A5 TaxID=2933946 RepID=A0ABV0JUZ4_9CYAN|nr:MULTISPECIES: HdeD family acid-resistance protein [unclassified Trichocoleus]MBD1906619.1 HdeD family acid-resistance protein [Trichocoleus sp. FACHB-832]MBD2061522.1 HdeD family acid-resistance protein [Trichocoleus sp. FACHB-6]